MFLRPSIDRWPHPSQGDAALAARISALYLALATLWILLGRMLAPASGTETWALAVASAGGLFLLLRWFARAVRRQELPLLKVAEHAGDAITITDAGLRIIYANPAACAMTGYPRADLIGKPIADLLPARDRPTLEAHIARLQHESSRCDEWSILRQDGSESMAEISTQCLPEGHFLAVARDLTPARRAESALRESEERFRAVVEGASDAVFVSDEAGRIVSVNAQACHILGYRRDELMAMGVADLRGEFPPAAQADPRRIPDPGEALTVNGRHRRKDGTTFPVEVRISAIQLNGQRLRLALARDVSDRERTLAALRKSEEFNRAVLDSTASQIAVLDRSGAIIAVNEAWRRFGENHSGSGDYPARAGIGADFLDSYRNTAADAHERIGPALDGIEAVLSGRSESFSVDCTCLANGLQPCFMMRVTPLRSGSGGAVVAYQDITPIHLAQEAREQANRQLEALALRHVAIQEEERRALSRELHDHIGQTLTALKIGLDAARRRCGELCHDHRSESAIARSCDITDGLIDTIRHLSLRLRPALLDDLGLAAAVRWHLETSPLPASIAVEIYENLDGDRFDTETELACFRVVQESVSNALRHSGAGEISISLIRCPGELHVAVRDNGCGFDVGVFEHRRDLNSLGLLGMRERVAGLDGRFSVESRPGGGTEVIASFPLPVTP